MLHFQAFLAGHVNFIRTNNQIKITNILCYHGSHISVTSQRPLTINYFESIIFRLIGFYNAIQVEMTGHDINILKCYDHTRLFHQSTVRNSFKGKEYGYPFLRPNMKLKTIKPDRIPGFGILTDMNCENIFDFVF